MQKEFR